MTDWSPSPNKRGQSIVDACDIVIRNLPTLRQEAAEGSVVIIRWLDSGCYYEQGWETKEEILAHSTGLTDVTTCGILFHEDETTYYVALSADDKHGHYFGVQMIAKQNVKEFTVVRNP